MYHMYLRKSAGISVWKYSWLMALSKERQGHSVGIRRRPTGPSLRGGPGAGRRTAPAMAAGLQGCFTAHL